MAAHRLPRGRSNSSDNSALDYSDYGSKKASDMRSFSVRSHDFRESAADAPGYVASPSLKRDGADVPGRETKQRFVTVDEVQGYAPTAPSTMPLRYDAHSTPVPEESKPMTAPHESVTKRGPVVETMVSMLSNDELLHAAERLREGVSIKDR